MADDSVDRWYWPRGAAVDLRDRLSEHLGRGVYGPQVDLLRLPMRHPFAAFEALRPTIDDADFERVRSERLLHRCGLSFEEDLVPVELKAAGGDYAEHLYDAVLLPSLTRSLDAVIRALAG